MAGPAGTLTAAQHEILEVIWSGPEGGATVTEIWNTISRQRKVTRTTVLNQVDRLEKRGWLQRSQAEDGYRYVATLGRDAAARELAEGFVDAYFGGSPSDLVMSLLGSKKFKPAEVARLREMLDARQASRKPKGKE